jgi:hypothetical protein
MYTTYLLNPSKSIRAKREGIKDYVDAVKQADAWFRTNTDCTATVWENGFVPVYTVGPLHA